MREAVVAIVDAPEISLSDDDLAGDALVYFYKALGWDGQCGMDPRKVRTTCAVYGQLFKTMRDKCPEAVAMGMLMVMKGPGVDDDVPPGKVYLLDGWLIPDREGEAME
jgi:hypothetical protein